MSRRRAAAPSSWVAALICLSAAVLTSCGGLGGSPQEQGDQCVHDEDSERWFLPGSLTGSSELVAEHLPTLQTSSGLTLIDGQFTDPHERVPLPAQDDYWWQAVVTLAPAEVEKLATTAQAVAASGSIGGVPERLDDGELRSAIVGSLEEEISPCPAEWLTVTPVLTQPGYANRTAAGDGLEVLAICPGGDQLIVSAFDM